MTLALEISCDAPNCEARNLRASDDPAFFGGMAFGLYGSNGGGWIDGAFGLPEGWTQEQHEGKFYCPEHSAGTAA